MIIFFIEDTIIEIRMKVTRRETYSLTTYRYLSEDQIRLNKLERIFKDYE